MTLFEVVAALITLSAAASYASYRWLRLPTTIGVMLIGLAASVALMLAGRIEPAIAEQAGELLAGIDFNRVVMQGMLGALLFAGALHVNINDLAEQKTVISVLASLGVVASTFIIAGMMWLLFGALGITVRPIMCLLFGALISPTDPIAVLGIFKTLGVPKTLETKITGESLFNDGVGVVVFLVIAGIAGFGAAGHGGEAASVGPILTLFFQEAVGGAVFGLVTGFAVYRLLKGIDNYQVEILVSLALVMGGYALASRLHVSGPIAMVVAGLLIGNRGRRLAMSDRTREHLDTFWELIDEILNALLFVLIGLEAMVLTFSKSYLLAGVGAIAVVLLARMMTVGGSLTALRLVTGRRSAKHTAKIMTWAGLRGGISVALALSIPRAAGGTERDAILAVTYIVVIFSIAVQGLTLGPLIRACGLGASRASHPVSADGY